MYMDRLDGTQAETDFERIYQQFNQQRQEIEDKLKTLEAQKSLHVSIEEAARALVQSFLDTAPTSREVLVSLIK